MENMNLSQLGIRTDVSGTTAPGSSKDSPEKIRSAASQFEALLIGQVLRAAQADQKDGLFGGEEDESAASAMDFATDFFARALATRGGLGLTSMITKGLEHAASSETQAEQPATEKLP